MPLSPLYPFQYESILRLALSEDLGLAGDLTTDAVVEPVAKARGSIVSRRPGRVAGLDVAAAAFRLLDPEMRITPALQDGADVEAGATLLRLEGSARALLSAERTALNFIARLSGIASTTHGIVRAVSGSNARVICTRKTTPGLRALEKYAVRAGGGANHRFGLDDGVLIKDNHRLIAGGITEAVSRVRKSAGHMVKIEVEVDTLEELDEALRLDVDAVLLDNMDVATMAEAVRRVQGRAITEASGGITPETAKGVAATGVNLLSVGWITHSAPALDVSLEMEAG
jgi:nicotinate-nucleotide pyrophosphorylase (carboxylating)